MTVEMPLELELDLPEGMILAERYRIERRLGHGGMGAVYRATHVKMGRPFALKVLHRALLANPKVVSRFEREATISGKMRHPNVVSAVDVGTTDDGVCYLVMEYVDGGDLGALLESAPLAPSRIVALTRQICEGLHHAHQHGLIHRDLKPANILIERGADGAEIPRIVDFGIAVLSDQQEDDGAGRLTTHGMVLGTPLYMAPEQATAGQLDHRVDLFALGLIVYEMLSGTVPFDGTPVQVARANVLLDPPTIAARVPGLVVDPLLEAFMRRLLEKDPQQRPATARAARELLDLIEADRAAAARELGVEAAAAAPAPPVPARAARPVPTGAGAMATVMGDAARASTQPAAAIAGGGGGERALARDPGGVLARDVLAGPARFVAAPLHARAPTDTARVEDLTSTLGAHRRRRGMMLGAAALAALTALAAVLVVLIPRGRAPASRTAPLPPPVIATAPTSATPLPAEEAAAGAPEAPPEESPEATAPEPADADVLEPAPSAAPDAAEPRTGADRRRARRRAAASTPSAPSTVPAASTAEVAPAPSPAVASTPAVESPRAPSGTAPAPKVSLTTKYAAVGTLLGNLGTQGVDVRDLWNRYRRINKDQAAGDPELKRRAMLELEDIERAAKARRPKL
ncbi:MAG: protein kinase [Kofleriaceae bacterium]